MADAGAVVLAQAVARVVLQAVYHRVPDYHAFWSGLAMYTELLLISLGPAALTFILLRQRTRFAGVAAGLVTVSFVVALVTSLDLHWPGPYWVVFSGLVLAIFITAAAQRWHERGGQPTHPDTPLRQPQAPR